MPAPMMSVTRNPTAGFGNIEIEAVLDGTSRNRDKETASYHRSEVVTMRYSYPFRFLVPEKSNAGSCRWIYPLTFGGGLVSGDEVTADISIGAGCAAVVSSQESTKIYHCKDGRKTVQKFNYKVGDSSLLCVLPDPIVCYEDADFHQTQKLDMTTSSNLVFLDWLLSGRFALSESWMFKRYHNTLEVNIEDEMVIRDRAELEDTPLKTVSDAMEGFQVYGTCVILGDQVDFIVKSLKEKYGRKRDIGEKLPKDSVVSVSEVNYTVQGVEVSGCYLRFLAADMDTASPVIHDITTPLLPILGANPFERKL